VEVVPEVDTLGDVEEGVDVVVVVVVVVVYVVYVFVLPPEYGAPEGGG
jgi:hypothetical protein